MRTVCAALATAIASTRPGPPGRALLASSSPPGVPRRLSSSASSIPLTPTIASAGTPFGFERATRADGTGPTSPSAALASAPSGEARCPASVAAPSARTDPSRASSVARRGSAILAARAPRRGASRGTRADRDHAIPPALALPLTPPTILTANASASVPNRRVRTRTGTVDQPAGAVAGLARHVHCRRGRGAQRAPVVIGELAVGRSPVWRGRRRRRTLPRSRLSSTRRRTCAASASAAFEPGWRRRSPRSRTPAPPVRSPDGRAWHAGGVCGRGGDPNPAAGVAERSPAEEAFTVDPNCEHPRHGTVEHGLVSPLACTNHGLRRRGRA